MSIIKFWLIHYIYILHFIINAYTLRICIHIYVLNIIIYIQTYTSLRYWLWTNKAGTRTHTHTPSHTNAFYLTDSNKSYKLQDSLQMFIPQHNLQCCIWSHLWLMHPNSQQGLIFRSNCPWTGKMLILYNHVVWVNEIIQKTQITGAVGFGPFVICRDCFLLWPEIACTKNVRFQNLTHWRALNH